LSPSSPGAQVRQRARARRRDCIPPLLPRHALPTAQGTGPATHARKNRGAVRSTSSSGASRARTGDPLPANRSSAKPNHGMNTSNSLVEGTICRSCPTSMPESAGVKRPGIGPKWTPGWQPRTQQIWCVQPLRTGRLLPGTLARRGWRAPLTTCAPPQADRPGGPGPTPSPSLLMAAQAEELADRESRSLGIAWSPGRATKAS